MKHWMFYTALTAFEMNCAKRYFDMIHERVEYYYGNPWEQAFHVYLTTPRYSS